MARKTNIKKTKKNKKMTENKEKTGVIKKDAGTAVAKLLGIDLTKENIVYPYNHPTGDCIPPNHVAISLASKRETFFGVPNNAVNWH
jgi:hypothetical protein